MAVESGFASIAGEFAHGGDTSALPTTSTVVLLENGLPLGPAHSLHQSIRTLGAGRFSHWGTSLYFSASDNSDPRSNGRSYTWAVPAGGRCPLRYVRFTLVATGASFFATYQSHNQKVVSNANGYFMTYQQTESTVSSSPGKWRLLWSQNQGATFSQMYEDAAGNARAPSIETDGYGNLYLTPPDWFTSDSYLVTFNAIDLYQARPYARTVLPGALTDAKHASALDPVSNRLFYAPIQSGKFTVVNLANRVPVTSALLVAGPQAFAHYPLLSFDSGALYFGWTTTLSAVAAQNYHSNHAIVSYDQGQSWKNLSGQALTVPIVADVTGPSTVVSRPADMAAAVPFNWMDTMLARSGYVHFLHEGPPFKVHYARYSMTGAAFDRRVDQLTGQSLSFGGKGPSSPRREASSPTRSAPWGSRRGARSACW